MVLTIEILKYKGEHPTHLTAASFDQYEIVIGRSPESHFPLLDPLKYISRKHAVITCENGHYRLTDESQAGTLICRKDKGEERVHWGTAPLTSGDILKIGDYDLVISISEGQARQSPEVSATPAIPPDFDPTDLFEDFKDIEARLPSPPVSPPPAAIPPDFDPLELLQEMPGGELRPHATSAAGGAMPVGDDQPGLPDDGAPGGALPLEPVETEPVETASQPATIAPEGVDASACRQSHPPTDETLFHIFLEAAGLGDNDDLRTQDLPDLMRTVGVVFRELVDGLLTMLQGRAGQKDQFRVSMTALRPVENNPLKVSQSVEEALGRLLSKDHEGYVDAIEAVREGHADIMTHQLAMTAGIQVALKELLARFDPQRFAKPYEEGIVFQRKAKCWDAYSEAYPQIVGEVLQNLFGDAFARAYEAQLAAFRAAHNNKRLEAPKERTDV